MNLTTILAECWIFWRFLKISSDVISRRSERHKPAYSLWELMPSEKRPKDGLRSKNDRMTSSSKISIDIKFYNIFLALVVFSAKKYRISP